MQNKVRSIPGESRGKEKRVKTTIILIVVLVLLIVLGIVVFGFWNGYQIGVYAKEVKDIMEKSNEVWKSGEVEDTKNMEEMKERLIIIKSDAGKRLEELDKLKAPEKARDLGRKVKDYFETAGDVSEKILAVINYAELMDEIERDSQGLDTSSQIADPEGFIEWSEDFHRDLMEIIQKLEKATVPDEMKTFHHQYLSALKKMDSAVLEGKEYTSQGDFDKVADACKDFSAAGDEIAASSIPELTSNLDKLVSDQDKDKFDHYPEEVKNEADGLVKIKFYFSLVGLTLSF